MNSVNDPLRWPLPEMGEVAALQKDLTSRVKQSGFAMKVPPCRKKKCWNEDTTPKSTLQNPWAFYPCFFWVMCFFNTKETYVPTPRPWGPPQKFFRSLWSAIEKMAIALRALHCPKRREVERKFPGFARFMSLSRKFFLTSPNEGLEMVVIHSPVSVNLANPCFRWWRKISQRRRDQRTKRFRLAEEKELADNFNGLWRAEVVSCWKWIFRSNQYLLGVWPFDPPILDRWIYEPT